LAAFRRDSEHSCARVVATNRIIWQHEHDDWNECGRKRCVENDSAAPASFADSRTTSADRDRYHTGDAAARAFKGGAGSSHRSRKGSEQGQSRPSAAAAYIFESTANLAPPEAPVAPTKPK